MQDSSFLELRADLRKRGYYERPTSRMLFELAINALMAGGGLAVYLTDWGLIARTCGLIVWMAGSIGIGTNTHNSSHYATSKKRWVNELLTYAGYSVYFGLPATYWWHKHVLVHHSAPNVIGVDGDADLSPWFATTTDEIRLSSGMRRFFYLHLQRFVFPAAIALTLFSQQIAGYVHLARALRREERQLAHIVDVAALFNVVLMLGIPMFFFVPSSVIAFYVLRNVVISYAMFSVFAPAHFLSEAARIGKDVAHVDYPLALTATTLNFRMGGLGRLMCSGLEYQIEHHLLPDISYVHYPAISSSVEQFCKSHALPYRRYRWEFALWRSLSAICNPCEIVHDASVLRQPAGDNGALASRGGPSGSSSHPT